MNGANQYRAVVSQWIRPTWNRWLTMVAYGLRRQPDRRLSVLQHYFAMVETMLSRATA